jgi:hypothetical protein
MNRRAASPMRVVPFVGHLYLENVHTGTLKPYIEYGKKMGWENRTINMPLSCQAYFESRGR